jgi:hypothetical protein
MAEHPTEQGHWYDPKTGEARYTYLNAKGVEKPTTLREARKFGWVPSVSGIIKCADRPSLNNWKIDQAILSALTCPKLNDESEGDYLSRIKKDAQEQARKAAERGTYIHSVVQRGFEGKLEEAEVQDDVKYYLSARKTIEAECGPCDWKTEKPFATDRYGGKVDLHAEDYIIDVKTHEKDDPKVWPEHSMQLEAYARGICPDRDMDCGILFIHVKTAEAKLIWLDREELDKGWLMFNALLSYWYAKSGL